MTHACRGQSLGGLYETSETRPEAGFRPQRRVVAVTGLDARPGIAVGQPRQVFGPIARQRDAPRQADVKVRIEGPHPVAPHFVVDALANAAPALRRQFRGKRHLHQAAVRHGPIHVPARQLMPPQREDLHPHRQHQRPRIQ